MYNWAKCRSTWQQIRLFSAVPLQVLVGPVALWVSVVDTSGALDLNLYGMIYALSRFLPSKIHPSNCDCGQRELMSCQYISQTCTSSSSSSSSSSSIAFPLTICLLSINRKHASLCQIMTKIRTLFPFVTHLLKSSWPQLPLPRVVLNYQLFRANWGIFHTNKCGYLVQWHIYQLCCWRCKRRACSSLSASSSLVPQNHQLMKFSCCSWALALNDSHSMHNIITSSWSWPLPFSI